MVCVSVPIWRLRKLKFTEVPATRVGDTLFSRCEGIRGGLDDYGVKICITGLR